MRIVVVGSKDISEYEKIIKDNMGEGVVIVGEDVTIVGTPKFNIPFVLTMKPYEYNPPPSCKKYKGYERPYKYHK